MKKTAFTSISISTRTDKIKYLNCIVCANSVALPQGQYRPTSLLAENKPLECSFEPVTLFLEGTSVFHKRLMMCRTSPEAH